MSIQAWKSLAVRNKPEKQQQSFPFLRLPLEIRRHLYRLVLPGQDVSLQSGQWANMRRHDANEYMNLLVANKQILEEAQDVLYGTNSFTMIIGPRDIWRLGSFSTELYPFMRQIFPLRHTKHWQLHLQTEDYYDEIKDLVLKEILLIAATVLSKIPKLLTLKISIPCLCDGYGSWHDPEDVHDNFVNILSPLNHLRFIGDVQLIAVPHTPCNHNDLEHPDTQKYAYSRFECSANNEQCQESICRSFAASFVPILAVLNGDTKPLSFTHDEIKYLEIKRRCASTDKAIQPGICPKINTLLNEAWDALELGSEEHLDFTYKGILKRLAQGCSHWGCA